jgi:hypothetical protein
LSAAKTYAQIIGWGRYVPSKVLTNTDLSRMVETSDEWIRKATGIGERHIAGPKESTSSMGVRAALAALEVADLPPSKIDLVITATITPDFGVAASASQIQDGIGATHAGAFDLNAGCSGFVYALSIASRLIESGAYRNILVVGADTCSRIVDWTVRATCVLFGDGAGAVVLQATDQPTGLMSCVLGSDGSGAESLYVPSGGSRQPTCVETQKVIAGVSGMKTVSICRPSPRRSRNFSVPSTDRSLPTTPGVVIVNSAASAARSARERSVISSNVTTPRLYIHAKICRARKRSCPRVTSAVSSASQSSSLMSTRGGAPEVFDTVSLTFPRTWSVLRS